MEEILASIRRIISDDEAKPAAAASPSEPASAPRQQAPSRVEPSHPAAAPGAKPVMAGIPPSKFSTKPASAPAPQPVPAAKNSQDDIDAMLAGFDAPGTEAVAADSEVFELTEQMAIPEPSAGFRKIEPEDDLEFSETPPAALPPRTTSIAPQSYDRPAPPESGPAMLSSSTSAAVESAFNALANTVLSNNARTLEDLVKEMLRPMLKSWLDDNLPGLVERIVKAEIERVARGR